MEWLRNNLGPILPSNGRLQGTEEEFDPQACFDSFKQHWRQVLKIVKRTQDAPSHDDVLSVVNHLEQMSALLQYDIKKIEHSNLLTTKSKCLELLFDEGILEKLVEWSSRTGKYKHAMIHEQFKLYEMLICQTRHVLILNDAFLKPLLKLFASCVGEVFKKQVELHLINLLYQICIVLMQNIDLVDLFFENSGDKPKFTILTLLLPFIHRDDEVAMQARDSVLLCLSWSKKNQSVKKFILDQSNLCAVLASGLGGLYSTLPQVIEDIAVPDWHKLTADDVKEIKHLSTFITSLEFSNSVAQMGHRDIVKQLQDFIYMGFFIPVFGPALLQTALEEQIAVTAYLELILRTVTNPGLLQPLLKFLLTVDYDRERLLDILMRRIDSTNVQLSVVSLALFHTLVDLNCEDVMLELVFHHLQPCLHLMISQRKINLPIDPYCESADKFLSLATSCSEPFLISNTIDGKFVNWNHYGGQVSLYANYHAYLCDAKNKIHNCKVACSNWTNSYSTCENHAESTEDPCTSLPSLGESSGYESLKIKSENAEEVSWQVSAAQNDHKSCNIPVPEIDGDQNSANAGPFLTIVLEKLKNMLGNSFYVNLHLTGLITRLAIYSHPLSRAYLLDHSLVLQPNVPSLFQILGSLKQQIDEFISHQPEKSVLVQFAKNFLLKRETRLVDARRLALDPNSLGSNQSSNSNGNSSSSSEEPPIFQRNGPKRRSLTQSLSSMFVRRQSIPETNIPLTCQTDDARSAAYHPKFTDAQQVAVCAKLMDEWVKELAALAQEHAISQLAVLLK